MAAPLVARQPSLFLPHGGGPLPLLGDPGHKPLVAFLRDGVGGRLAAAAGPARPRAILLVSAHWQEPVPTIGAGAGIGAQWHLLYDYDGFPPAAYEVQYPAPAPPAALVERVASLLAAAGFAPRVDAARGLDHGAFVPLKVALPGADVPVVPLSLLRGLDPRRHLEMGRALAPLRDEGVAVVASGMSFHNMRAFFGGAGPASPGWSRAFHGALRAAVEAPTAAERWRALEAWERMPDARACHPAEEHLLPLMVAAGAGAEAGPGEVLFEGELLGHVCGGYAFP